MSVTDDKVKNGIERYDMLFGFINDVVVLIPLGFLVSSQLVATPFCTLPVDVVHLTRIAVM